MLDRLKQKESTRRVLFLHGHSSHYYKNMTVANGRAPACEEQHVYLRVSEEGEGLGAGLLYALQSMGKILFGLCGVLAAVFGVATGEKFDQLPYFVGVLQLL